MGFSSQLRCSATTSGGMQRRTLSRCQTVFKLHRIQIRIQWSWRQSKSSETHWKSKLDEIGYEHRVVALVLHMCEDLAVQKAICGKLGFTFISIAPYIVPDSRPSFIWNILKFSFHFCSFRSRVKKSNVPTTGNSWAPQGWRLLGDAGRAQTRELIIEDLTPY